MILLYTTDASSNNSRKMRAITNLRDLSYKNDPGKFLTEALEVIHDVQLSQVTINDMILHSIMASFEGKDTFMHQTIAQDINNPDIFGETRRCECGHQGNHDFLDLLSKYTQHLTTISKAKQESVNQVLEKDKPKREKCKFCGIKGHTEAECRKKQAGYQALADQGSGNGTAPPKKCDWCLKPGHT